MILIHQPIAAPNLALAIVPLRVDRITIAKRLWRGTAEDGEDFGFELGATLKHGDTVFETPVSRYVVEQMPEPVLEISLAIAPSAAAGVGWAIGNLHLELQAEVTRLLTADEPAVRQLLERMKVPFQATRAIFRPGRFVRGEQQVTHELGASHRH